MLTEIRPLFFLVLILIFAAGVWFFAGGPAMWAKAPAVSPEVAQEIPAFTPEIAAQLEKSNGFQMLVSYTERGFEPARATVKSGDTVRFTNNSTHGLWIMEDAVIDCKSNCFNTNKVLNPGDFWEYRFNRKGARAFHNNQQQVPDAATIQVQ